MNATSIRTFRRRGKGALRRLLLRARDALRPTFGAEPAPGALPARLIPGPITTRPSAADAMAVDLYLAHRFDLLGSGWVRVHHGMSCRGFDGQRFPPAAATAVNRANRSASAAIAALLPPDFPRIDWQLDFRSGYRWSESKGYRDIRYGHVAGADVKVPWELSRAQHLPELALAYHASRERRLADEFRNQVLDWIAHNPPRFGVNWACTMDAGIRVANWLLAFDLFRAAGAAFDAPFVAVFMRSLVAHGEHIVRNLEWSEMRRANHYLGNIAGLACLAAYLPGDARADAWLVFAIQELEAEAEHQFLPDGGHFEASTSYHRLCAEMLAVSAAVLAALPPARIAALLARPEPRLDYGPGIARDSLERIRRAHAASGHVLSAGFFARLHAAARFTHALTRADGSVPLIGDDDSGRFIRLSGWLDGGSVADARARFSNLAGFTELPDEARYPLQSGSHQSWLAWEGALRGSVALLQPELATGWATDHELARALTRRPLPVDATADAPPLPPRATSLETPGREFVVTASRDFAGASLLDGAVHSSHAWSGVFVLRSQRLHLVIRCGDALRDGAGVHAHEDQLSIDLVVDGQPVARDPGTFVYTAAPELRSDYRSAAAHCSPSARGPTAPGRVGTFAAPAQTFGECRVFAAGRFEGRAQLPGGSVTRHVVVETNRIVVRDEYKLQPGWQPASTDPFSSVRPVAFSPAYGVRLAVDPR